MKSVRSDQSLYYFPQEDFPKQDVLKWRGQLTPFQDKVSQGLLQAVDKQEPSLVHAVTGAGKTEMIDVYKRQQQDSVQDLHLKLVPLHVGMMVDMDT